MLEKDNDAESGLCNVNDYKKSDLNHSNHEYAMLFLRLCLKVVIWSLLFALFIRLEFGLVYFICSLIFFICYNTSKRKKGRLSPYSVFNRNLERMKSVSEHHSEDNMVYVY